MQVASSRRQPPGLQRSPRRQPQPQNNFQACAAGLPQGGIRRGTPQEGISPASPGLWVSMVCTASCHVWGRMGRVWVGAGQAGMQAP